MMLENSVKEKRANREVDEAGVCESDTVMRQMHQAS